MVSGLSACQTLHQLSKPGNLLRCHKQVHMVCHQAVGINLDAVNLLELHQGFQIAFVITRLGKDYLPVMSALNNMMWVVLQDGSADPWHAMPPVL